VAGSLFFGILMVSVKSIGYILSKGLFERYPKQR